MIPNRNRNIVITSQFNINGSRGKDAGKFIADYISRDSATDQGLAYRPNVNKAEEIGDGAAFTLSNNGVSRQEVLDTAKHVQELHLTGKRAIQQMVISFDPDYLKRQHLVPQDIEILKKGDYRYQYDDLRIRDGVRRGLQSLIDQEGYNDGKAIACIQWDTRHLHVHAVVYEDAKKIARKRGYEEKGVLKESSLNQMASDIDQRLTLTRTNGLVPNQQNLYPEEIDENAKAKTEETPKKIEAPYVDTYLQLIEQRKREQALEKKQIVDKAYQEVVKKTDEDQQIRENNNQQNQQ